MLFIAVTKIRIALKYNKPLINKRANRQEKNEKVSKILTVNSPYLPALRPFVRSFMNA